MKIKIKFFGQTFGVEKIPQGDWIDLYTPRKVTLSGDRFKKIPLGVAMQLPKGYEAHVAPRGSTFRKWGIIQTNGVGVVDESYCGDNDEWFAPVVVLDDKAKFIPAGTRLFQFRIMKKQPKIEFDVVQSLDNPDRGGDGSTDG